MSNRRFPTDHPLRFLHAQQPYGPDVWAVVDLHQLSDDDLWVLGFDELTDAELIAQDGAELPLTIEQYRRLSGVTLSWLEEEAYGLFTPHPTIPAVHIPTARGNRMLGVGLRLSAADVQTICGERGLPQDTN